MRLLEMVPDLCVFLDKDDLKTGAGAEYIDVSSSVLCFCTAKYFRSRACAREIFRALVNSKPLIAVLEPDVSRGGLRQHEIEELLLTTRYPPHAARDDDATVDWSSKWDLDGEVAMWGKQWGIEGLERPSNDDIAAALFKQPAIEWNRLTAFKDVTVRLIAERLLNTKFEVYLQGTIGWQADREIPLTHRRQYHLYCSRSCPGARELVYEMNTLLGTSLKWTSKLEELSQCEHFLLYLTARTWTGGKASRAFAREVTMAQCEGVHLLLVHEQPSAIDDDAVRGACAFDEFWNDGWTPKHLLQGDANVYRQIAFTLKPGAWRMAGLVAVAETLAAGGGDRLPITHELGDETADSDEEQPPPDEQKQAKKSRIVPLNKRERVVSFQLRAPPPEDVHQGAPSMSTATREPSLARARPLIVPARSAPTLPVHRHFQHCTVTWTSDKQLISRPSSFGSAGEPSSPSRRFSDFAVD